MQTLEVLLPSQIIHSVEHTLSEDGSVTKLSSDELLTYPNFRVTTIKTSDGKDKASKSGMSAWLKFEICLIKLHNGKYQAKWSPVIVKGSGIMLSGGVKPFTNGIEENTRKYKNQVALNMNPEDARFYQKEGISNENYGAAKIHCHNAFWYHFRIGVKAGSILPFVDKENHEDYQTERLKNPKDKRDKTTVKLDTPIIRVGLRQVYNKDGQETGDLRCKIYNAKKPIQNPAKGTTPFELYTLKNNKPINILNIHEVITYPSRVTFVDNMSQGQMTTQGGNKLFSSAEFIIILNLPKLVGIQVADVVDDAETAMFKEMADEAGSAEEVKETETPEGEEVQYEEYEEATEVGGEATDFESIQE